MEYKNTLVSTFNRERERDMCRDRDKNSETEEMLPCVLRFLPDTFLSRFLYVTKWPEYSRSWLQILFLFSSV